MTASVGQASRPVTAEARLPGDFAFFPALLALAVLSLLVPAQVVTQVSDQGRSTAWRYALVVMVWAGARISLLIGRGQPRFFVFFFWLYTYVFLGVAPAVQIRSNQPSTTTPDVLPSLDGVALKVVILGLVCFEIGSALAHLIRPHVNGRTGGGASGVPARRVVVLWTVGMLAGTYYIGQMGLDVLYSNRDAAAAARAALWPDPPIRSIVQTFSVYPTLVAVGGLTLLLRRTMSVRRQLVHLAMIAAGVGMLSVVVSPLSTARYPLGTVIFGLAVLFGATRTSAWVRLTSALAILGLFFLFPLADAFRRNERDFVRAGFLAEYKGNPDYDSIWQIANAAGYWMAGKAEVGSQALGTVFFWIPRSIWESKPVDTGVLLANYYGYRFTNLSAPLWAEAMVNGGVVAVVVVFVALGYLLRRLDFRVMNGLLVGNVWVLVGAILPVYLMIILRGSLLQATGTMAVVIVCLAFVRPQPREADVRRSTPGAPTPRTPAPAP